jgi:hypothetical protein
MCARSISSVFVVICIAWFSIVVSSVAASDTSDFGSDIIRAAASPLLVPNRGQWETRVRFGLLHGSQGAWVEDDGFAISRQSATGPEVLRVRFVESSPAKPRGSGSTDAQFHLLRGNDPARWQTNLPGYRRVEWTDIWPHIDVVLHAHATCVEYDVVLRPGADASNFRIDFIGSEQIRVTNSGAVEIHLGDALVIQSAPRAYFIELDGSRHAIQSRFVQSGAGSITLAATAEVTHSTVIDPGLEWATFIGGVTPLPGTFPVPDELTAVQLLANDTFVVVGRSGFVDYPVTAGALQPTITPPAFVGGAGFDGVISKFASNGTSLIFSTFLGGKASETISDVAVLSGDRIAVGGYTSSSDFPITPGAYQLLFPSAVISPAFVTILSATGSQIESSTYLSGFSNQGIENVIALAAAPDGAIAVAGHTWSTDFPVTPGAFDPVHSSPGNIEGFLTVFNPTLTGLVYSTFLGGSKSDRVIDLEADGFGFMTVCGESHSPDFPVTPNAIGPTAGLGNGVGVAARFGPDGAPVYSTYLSQNGSGSIAHGLAVENSGHATIVGEGFVPVTPGSWNTNCGGNCAFALRLTPQGAIEWGTYLGGFAITPTDVAIDSRRGAVVAIDGPNSLLFPFPPGAFDTIVQGDETMVLRLDSQAKSVFYGTMFGGSGADILAWPNHSIAIDSTDSAVIAGSTSSADLSVTPGALSTMLSGSSDGFVAKLDLLPTGASKYGIATPGCSGKPVIGLTAMPKTGQKLSITCGRAPPNSTGFLIIGDTKAESLPETLGATLYVDPTQHFVLVPLISGSDGNVHVTFRLSSMSAPPGTRRFAQFVFRDPCISPGIATSNALEVIVQG